MNFNRVILGGNLTREQRFWAKVVRQPGCWRWTGAKSKGYGLLSSRRGSAPYKAHRVSWEINVGPIPNGLHVLHSCDNPECTRPDHLFLGTHRDNMADATAKGRMKVPGKVHYGENHPIAKLNEAKVKSIRQLFDEGWTKSRIGRLFGIHRSTVRHVVNRMTWRNCEL